MEVRSTDDLENAFKAAMKARSGALAVVASPLLDANQERIADLATRNRLPAICDNGEYVKAGALMAYGPNLVDLYRRAATYVDKILKGTKPADLPEERPNQVRAGDQSKDGEADRPNDSAVGIVTGGQGDQVTYWHSCSRRR